MAGDDVITKVTLAKPTPGETVRIPMQTGHVYILDFYLDITTFSDDGRDIRIQFDDGSDMLLQDFFTVAKTGDFYLELPDGVMLLGKDIADAMSYKLEDFHPSNGHFYSDDAHCVPWPSGLRTEDRPASGPVCSNYCSLPVNHDNQDHSSAMDTLAKAVPLTSQADCGSGSSVFPPFTLELDGMSDTMSASSLTFSSSRGGSLFLYLDELLDSSPAVVPPAGNISSPDLGGLLAPQMPPEPGPPAPGTESENITAPGAAVGTAGIQPVDLSHGAPLDTSPDQSLLTYLLLTSF